GMPSRSGVTSALLVRAVCTGIDDILSGPDNFLLAHGRSADAAVLADKLGERYEVMRTNIKKWSVGSPIQAALDALEILLQRRPFAPGDVRKVVVRLGTRSASVVNNRDIPDIAAHGGGDADRPHRLVRRGARRGAHARRSGAARARQGGARRRRGARGPRPPPPTHHPAAP